MSVMRFLQNILCLLFVPLLLGRPRASGIFLLPMARDALLGETPFRGNPRLKSRVTPSRRAQGFDPEAEPNRKGPESETRNCGNGITDQISKAG